MRPLPDSAPPLRRGSALTALLAITLLGLALRCIGITGESAWWDEYSSLVHLKSATLLEFLANNRTYDPATLPLYYTLEYLWSRIAGTGTALMRVPSLALGALLIPAAYALGATLISRRAGLLVAACVALSPIHLFHAQGIRMYVLFTLLAVLSMTTFLRFRLQPTTPRLALHAFVQLLLSWTHPFAVLLPVVQGIAWLLGSRASYPGTLRWGFATAFAWLPALVYLSTLRYYPQEFTNWIVIPDLQGLFHDLFQDDVIRAGYQVQIAPRAWEWLPFGLGSLLLRAAPLWDAALTLAVLLPFGVALYRLARAWRGGEEGDRASLLLLLLWSVLPVFLLLIASWTFRPMIAPRYTVHCSIAFYLLAAALVARLPRWRRFCGEAVLCLLLLLQTGAMFPGPQRTDYLGVGAYVQTHANPATDVAVVTTGFEKRILEYNVTFAPLTLLSRESNLASIALADALLQSGMANVWVIHVIPYGDAPPMPAHWAQQFGLGHEVIPFRGIQGIELTRVFRLPDAAPPDTRAAAVAGYHEGINKQGLQAWFSEMMRELQPISYPLRATLFRAACDTCNEINPALALLSCGDRSGEISPQRVDASVALTQATDDQGGGGEATTDTLARIAEIDPAFGTPHALLAVQYAASGEHEKSLAAFGRAVAADPALANVLGEYVAALQRKDLPAAEAGAERCREALGGDTVDLLREVAHILLKAPAP